MTCSEKQIKALLEDPIILKIIKFMDRTSLSILELLEFGISRGEINHALATTTVVFDKAPIKSADDYGVATAGDYYFDFLSSKVKLSDLGLLLLERLRDT